MYFLLQSLPYTNQTCGHIISNLQVYVGTGFLLATVEEAEVKIIILELFATLMDGGRWFALNGFVSHFRVNTADGEPTSLSSLHFTFNFFCRNTLILVHPFNPKVGDARTSFFINNRKNTPLLREGVQKNNRYFTVRLIVRVDPPTPLRSVFWDFF